jgi:bacterioferritin-associated ferredoxin
MNDQEIRNQAQSFLNSQQLTDQAFFADIKRYIAEIPLDPRLLRHCFICASASCGVCGDCHKLAEQVLSLDRKHMIRENRITVQPRGTIRCVAWIWAYLFLCDAEYALNAQNR